MTAIFGSRFGGITAALLSLSATSLAPAQSYVATELGSLPGGSTSTPAGINNSGTIVGNANTTGGTHAFSYSNGVMSGASTSPAL